MDSSPLTPHRRSCLRGCVGCLFHHPITVLATFFGLVLWLPQLLRVAMYLLAGTEPDPWPLAWTTLLLVSAQLIPRITPMLYRAYLARRARVRDRQLAPTHAAVDPTRSIPVSWRVAAGASAGNGPEWRLWPQNPVAVWTDDANASTYDGSTDDGALRSEGTGTFIRLYDSSPSEEHTDE